MNRPDGRVCTTADPWRAGLVEAREAQRRGDHAEAARSAEEAARDATVAVRTLAVRVVAVWFGGSPRRVVELVRHRALCAAASALFASWSTTARTR